MRHRRGYLPRYHVWSGAAMLSAEHSTHQSASAARDEHFESHTTKQCKTVQNCDQFRPATDLRTPSFAKLQLSRSSALLEEPGHLVCVCVSLEGASFLHRALSFIITLISLFIFDIFPVLSLSYLLVSSARLARSHTLTKWY